MTMSIYKKKSYNKIKTKRQKSENLW